MSIPELDRFRDKYRDADGVSPYDKIDDSTLLNAIIRKYPVYEPLRDKLAETLTPEKRAEIREATTPAKMARKEVVENPAYAEDLGMQVGKEFYEATKSIPYPYKDYVALEAGSIPAGKSLPAQLARGVTNAAVNLPAYIAGGEVVGGIKALQALQAVRNPVVRAGARALTTGLGMGAVEGVKGTSEALQGEITPQEAMLRTAGGVGTGAVLGGVGEAGSRLAVEGAKKFLPEVSKDVAERVGSAGIQGIAGATMAPEGEKIAGGIVGAGLGAVTPARVPERNYKQEINRIVEDGIYRGIRPSVVGKKTTSQQKQFNQRTIVS